MAIANSPTPPLSSGRVNQPTIDCQPLTDEELSALTSLDEQIDDCGKPKKNCPSEGCLIFDDCNGGFRHLFRTTCGRWTCPYCGQVKRAKLQERIQSARPNRFVTLTTCGHETETPRQIFDWTRRQISELAKFYRRTNREFEYLRALEQTKSGYPHYHLLVRSPWLEQVELSRSWCNFTRAYIVDVRSLTKDEKAARYVMKYLSKQHSLSFTQRRLSWTRNFFPPEPKPQKSSYCPINVQRFASSIANYFQWECNAARWEKINDWHYTSKERFL